MHKPIIGITMGDPAGIGPEIAAKALTSPETQMIANCLVIGDRKAIREGLKIAKIKNTEINAISNVKGAKFTRGVIDVIDLDNVSLSRLKTGQVSAAAGQAAYEYIDRAIQLALAKEINAIATGPINKEALRKAGHKYDGHTEILAEKTKAKNYAMMFVSDTLWFMLVTTHVALKDVSKSLSSTNLLRLIKLANDFLLKDRGKKPKIGVAGLNPHAGEAGIFGNEEIAKIAPAVEAAKKLGINVQGPISPDAIFNLAYMGMFDLVIAMYHDQGLIPLKLLSFNKSVNVTVGLPIIRTSVDHGTGFNIAGKGMANPQSLIEAIKAAVHFAKNRKT